MFMLRKAETDPGSGIWNLVVIIYFIGPIKPWLAMMKRSSAYRMIAAITMH
jgi:hypothetical protein